ncbi:hypothetical protein MNBD_PLANCTO02-2362 [hydrothermal vent metagenome]|uniref:Lipopolysaccharide export system permease protein LptF n=1 Tax=hydrothermal vent metagenome TaxID=652676 RepID=A0A3B1DT95_9ZZZZ
MRLLQRYIIMELLRVFISLLSLLTILLLFVGVFREVSESGISMGKAIEIMPYIVPSLLPFTIPSTLLLTVCVVYGRIAGDSEIIAAKAAGINVMSLISPAILLGVILSVGSLVLTDRMIPWAIVNIQQTITEAMEDIFLDMLRKNHHVTNDSLGYSISVMEVKNRTLIMPTFKYRPKNGKKEIILQAQESTLEFDMKNQLVVLHLVRGYVDIPGQQRIWFEKEDKAFPLPNNKTMTAPRHIPIKRLSQRITEMSDSHERFNDEKELLLSMAFLTGDFHQLQSERYLCELPPDEDTGRINKLKTEIHSRYAMASSCLFFVLLGCPVSVLQAKKQFLTSFMFCFVPILLIYYPITLGMINLSKTGTVNPAWAMWLGNGLLFICSCFVLRKVMKH